MVKAKVIQTKNAFDADQQLHLQARAGLAFSRSTSSETSLGIAPRLHPVPRLQVLQLQHTPTWVPTWVPTAHMPRCR